MQKVILLLLSILSFQFTYSQQTGIYAFARTPTQVNYNFESSESTFSEGLSMGIGLTHQSLFLELGSFILDGNSYGHYTFFGSTVNSMELFNSINLNTNVFGEVTNIPAQSEQRNASWIFTGGVCFFPNAQFQRLNFGIPICVGLAYQDNSVNLNSRFILNLSYIIK